LERGRRCAPAPLPPDCYAALANKSPFALATIPALQTASEASFAVNWFVSGIARVGNQDFVTIKSRDAALQFSLFGREPNPQTGVSLAEVNWSETLGKATVVLQGGAETARLEFNEAVLRVPSVQSSTTANSIQTVPQGRATAKGSMPQFTAAPSLKMPALPWPGNVQPGPISAQSLPELKTALVPVIPWPQIDQPSTNPISPHSTADQPAPGAGVPWPRSDSPQPAKTLPPTFPSS
jgi:hypothetical protein